MSTDRIGRRVIPRPDRDGPRDKRPKRPTLVFSGVPESETPRAPYVMSAISVPPVAPPPPPRPSERPTIPTLPREPSSSTAIELSASSLESVDSVESVPTGIFEAPPPPPRLPSPESLLPTAPPPRVYDPLVSTLAALPRALGHAVVARAAIGPSIVAGLAILAAAGLFAAREGVSRASSPREAEHERTALASARPSADVVALRGACAAGAATTVAPRAELAPGLDVAVLDGAFAVGFAASATDAVALRLAGASLRVEDRADVRATEPVRHVAVDAAEDDRVEVRADADDVRTVMADRAGAPLRVSASDGWVHARHETSPEWRGLWAVPPAAGRAQVDSLAGVAREDGGAVVALRRGSTTWIGATDASLAPEGPLVALDRGAAQIGAPSVAPFGGRAFVAWAERAPGAEWSVAVASVVLGRPDVDVKILGAGMSPSIAVLPDGDVVVAYAEGAAGAHRVVVRRLRNDLEPRGGPVVASNGAVNAGQPRLAVAPTGRGIVAFFAAERRGSGAVLVAQVACDVGR